MRRAFFLFVFLYPIVSVSAQPYVFFTFDPGGSVSTSVTGINDTGKIAGNFSDAAGSHAFVRAGSVDTIIEAPGASQTVAGGINNPGQITGSYSDNSGTHGYIRSADGKSFTPFDAPAAGALTVPVAINDRGDVVGTAFASTGANAFLRTADGVFSVIRFPLANFTSPTGIANTGEIVGSYVNGGPLENRHGFVRHADGTYDTMDVPGTDSTEIRGVNNHGEVVGVVQYTHGFARDSAGGITILDALGASQTIPAGINDDREVAGYTITQGTSHGFLGVPGANSSQPEIRPLQGVISATAFGGAPTIAPGTWIEIYGRNLSPVTRPWKASDFSGNLAPASLEGVAVTINGRTAVISFISPGQINAQAPSTLNPGEAQVVINNNGRISGAYRVQVKALQPGLLQIPGRTTALTYAAALLPDQTYVLPPGFGFSGPSRRVRIGETVTLYGIGFGPTTPNSPAGSIATAPTGLAARVEARFGTTPAVVSYAGLSPGFVGVYQINLVVPDGALAPGRAYDDAAVLSLQFDGVTQSQTLLTAVER